MFIFRCKDSSVSKCVGAAMARKNSEGGPRKPKGPATPRGRSPDSPGHYAGCKWTEPPLPSALPPPPQHWMQAPPHAIVLPFRQPPKSEQHDIENQLKVLLKVQA